MGYMAIMGCNPKRETDATQLDSECLWYIELAKKNQTDATQ